MDVCEALIIGLILIEVLSWLIPGFGFLVFLYVLFCIA